MSWLYKHPDRDPVCWYKGVNELLLDFCPALLYKLNNRRGVMKTKTSWLLIAVISVAVGALAVIDEQTAWSVESQHPIKDIEKKIEGAKTKKDHKALAAHFELEAKALEEKAKQEDEMYKAYEKAGGYPVSKGGVLQHCSSLAAMYRKAAQENMEIAKIHHKMAGETSK
jgi:hypothetical protein